MRKLHLIFIFFIAFCSQAQKNFTLDFADDSHLTILKRPKLNFKDSVSAINYLVDFQNRAISKGYILASIDSILASKNHAYVHFYLGERFPNASINIDKEELKFIRRHSSVNEKFVSQIPLSPTELSRNLIRIRDVYLNEGYPFVGLSLANHEFTGSKLKAELAVDRGPYVQWKKIHIKGDSSIALNYISSLTEIKKGDPYDESKLKKISERIQQVPFLQELKPHEILFTKEGAELFIYVENVPVSSVNGIIGFQPNPNSSKLSVTGELNLKLLNVLKHGELLDIRWQSIQDQTQSLKARLNYPFLFKTSFGIDGTFDLYKRDTSFLELESTAGVQYFLNRGSYIKAFYRNTTSNVLSGGQNNPLFNRLGTTRSNNYGLSYFNQRLDYLPNPSKGFRVTLTGSAGLRNSQDSDTSETIRTNVVRALIDVEWFIPLAKRHVIRLANHTESYSAEEVFENEVFRFGGLSSQRGFNEDELFGTTLTTTTIEYRFLLDRNSHVFAFYDQTWYENNSFNYYNDQPFGFGAGFSFSTRLGVFSISYALGKQLDNPILLSNSKVHFGYIAYF